MTDRQGVAGQRKETSVFANPFPSEISIRAKRQGLVKRKKNSKALLGSRRLPLEFLSILHPWPFSQGKLSFRRSHPSLSLPSTSSIFFLPSTDPPSRLPPPLSFFLSPSLVLGRCVPCTTRNAQHSTCGFNLVNAGPRGSAVVSLIPGHFNRSIERALVMHIQCVRSGCMQHVQFHIGRRFHLPLLLLVETRVRRNDKIAGMGGKVVYIERD